MVSRERAAISKVHDGPGVVPGRYAGEAIPIHDGPTPEQLAFAQHMHVSADNLGDVPAGSQEPAVLRAETVEAQSTGGACIGGVPAETSQPVEAVCHIENMGSIETATAQKLACDNPVLGAVVDQHGRVLALGRTKRLVSTAQRRALMIRDHGMCQYPGCHQSRHLKAHHLVPWILGGRTDLENLILRCQWHHTAVHECGISISNQSDGWVSTKPDGQPCDGWVSDETLARHLDFARRHAQQQAAEQDQLAEVDSFHHPEARIIRPGWTGEPFDLHTCVQALFTLKLPKPGEDQDQQAA